MFKLSKLLLNARKAEKHPLGIFTLAFLYTSLSIFISYWIFPNNSSLVMVFLSVISCLYVVEKALIIDERKESDYRSEYSLLRQHFRTLSFLFLLFLAFLAAFTFWTLILPSSISNQIFDSQKEAFNQIQSISGKSTSFDSFSTIFSNNIRVLFLSLIFAVFYGAGAIFILAWNASIMGFVIGSLTKNSLGLSYLPYTLLKYFAHGIPEMLSYLTAALAGSIIFISIIKGDFREGKTRRIITDSIFIVLISVILMTLAAFIEAYISPGL